MGGAVAQPIVLTLVWPLVGVLFATTLHVPSGHPETTKRCGKPPPFKGGRGDFAGLARLFETEDIEGMNVPTFRLHPLKGDLKGSYAVSVRASWRIIFRFEDGNAFDVDFVDYH